MDNGLYTNAQGERLTITGLAQSVSEDEDDQMDVHGDTYVVKTSKGIALITKKALVDGGWEKQ